MPRTRAPRRWSQPSARPTVVDLHRSAHLLRAPDRAVDRRALAVLRVLELHGPALTPGAVAVARLLGGVDWLRPVDRWTGGSERALVDHLIRGTRYELPAFLYACLGWEERFPRPRAHQALAFRVLATVGVGKPLREVPELRTFPRVVLHLVWTTVEAVSVVAAVRRAQVRAAGGPGWLADALAVTGLGQAFQRDEARWTRALAVLAADAASLPQDRVGPIVDYLLRTPSAEPRTVARLLRDEAQWHGQWLRPATSPSGPLPRSGFGGAQLPDAWSVVELDSGSALVQEGAALRHCVATYHGQVVGGRSSIWSVRRAGGRVLTVEVWNAERAVVQIRGFANRRASPQELTIVRQWASEQGLTVRSGA